VTGARRDEARPELIVCVTDATNLKLNLRLVLEAKQLNLPMVLALNMSDEARRQGIHIDTSILASELGMPVVETVAVHSHGAKALVEQFDAYRAEAEQKASAWQPADEPTVIATQQEVRRILSLAATLPRVDNRLDDRIDAIVLHPVLGMLVLAVTLFLMFQAVFTWAQVPMDAIQSLVDGTAEFVRQHMAAGMLESLIADGVIAGAGSVLVFLPQILILFLFILALEDSGYLPRAAFLLDRLMGVVGLSGRSFIPLLSSFACAIPGVMATRTISDWRDRLVTIMIAPLMTCSARLPVYALLIAAFIPQRTVGGIFNLQGLVLFVLYAAGILSAMLVAWLLKKWRTNTAPTMLMMELPAYRLPNLRNLAMGLYERAGIFVSRVGTIILSLMIVLWFLSSVPSPPADATGPAIRYSLAGMIGGALEHIFAPIGFNWQISIALVPGLAAREVAVSALGTVYALSASGDDVANALTPMIVNSWSLATALSLLAWYVFAPQCISTLAAVKRETNSWRYPLIMAGYLFALAYAASFVTYRAAVALGWG
jgi:ferrous iron transport protein B